MPSSDPHDLLTGRDRDRTYRWLGAGAALLAATVLGLLVFHLWEPNRRLARTGAAGTVYAMYWGGVLALALAGAVVSAFRNGGWAVSVGLVVVPAAALAVHDLVAAFLALPRTEGLEELLREPAALVVLSLVVGTLAFAAGSGTRRFVG
jgi:hypothetical protein